MSKNVELNEKLAKARCQTWQERLNDAEKEPLAAPFVESIVLTAHANERAVEDVWTMWRTYEQQCEAYDQSAEFREFCSRFKLAGAGPLA